MNLSIRIVTFFLAFHILNFSLDIPSYNSPNNSIKTEKHDNSFSIQQDEIESILELVIEIALEEDDFFPDTEETDSQNDSFQKKADWIIHSFLLNFSFFENIYTSFGFVIYTLQIKNLTQDISSPPPKV